VNGITGKIQRMDAPQVILIAIEPKTTSDGEKLVDGLRKLMAEDPTFRIDRDTQTGQTIVRGTDELQLEMIVDRLEREFNVEVTVGKPQVACKETVTQTAEGVSRYVKHIGGSAHYAHAKIRLLPGGRGSGYIFENHIVGGVIPEKFVRPIDDGIQEALTRGVLAGYPVDDVRIELYGGSFHDVDSSEMAFKAAGAMAFRDAAKKAEPVVLEPIMNTEVVVPEEYVGAVIGDINSRRGQIEGMELRDTTQIIRAKAPLSEMLGYAADIRSLTQGRANYSMKFDRYEVLPNGPNSDDEDRCAPVTAPRSPAPRGRESGVRLPEPGEGSKSS
jgi:elongation factor G